MAAPEVNTDAEAALIGACLQNTAAITAAIETGVTADMFIGKDHGTMWQGITDLHAHGQPVDPVTVAGRMAHYDDRTKWAPILVDYLADRGFLTSNAHHYAEAVRDAWRERHITFELQACLNGSRPDWRARFSALVAEVDSWDTPLDDTGLHHAIDWEELWNHQAPEHEWLAEPVLPAGRQVAIFSIAKTGKSLLALEIAAALATGRPVLNQPAAAPMHVMYVDMEMTADDLRERLESLDYGPHTDLAHLHYYQLADLPPLDTAEGGATIHRLARHHQAELVVVDTMARAVGGDENEADTYRDFYRHTGRHLKAAGIALLRLDHAGKDGVKGQRGSSAKDDDVDLVWRLTIDRDLVTLHRTRSRIAWAPQTINLTRTDHDGILRHIVQTDDTYPAGTADVAALLDQHDVPLDASVRTAMTTLKTHGTGKRQLVVQAALRYRRTQ